MKIQAVCEVGAENHALISAACNISDNTGLKKELTLLLAHLHSHELLLSPSPFVYVSRCA